MTVEKGVETIYAAFSNKQALDSVEYELKTRFGKTNVDVTTIRAIREDVEPNDVIDFIPTWYEYLFEKQYADLIKESIKAAGAGEKVEPSKMEKLKDFLVSHPEFIL